MRHEVNSTEMSSGFSFSQISCPTKDNEYSLPYYLPIVGGSMGGYISFPGVLALCEM